MIARRPRRIGGARRGEAPFVVEVAREAVIPSDLELVEPEQRIGSELERDARERPARRGDARVERFGRARRRDRPELRRSVEGDDGSVARLVPREGRLRHPIAGEDGEPIAAIPVARREQPLRERRGEKGDGRLERALAGDEPHRVGAWLKVDRRARHERREERCPEPVHVENGDRD